MVFAKAPAPGRVKTRMCPPLSAEQAAAFYACLLDDVLESTAAVAPRLGLAPILAVHPPDACEALARRAPRGFRALGQRGPDLSARMEAAAADVAALGHAPVLLRGSDSPALGAAVLASALRALEVADVVICPDRDGGYNLIGMREPVSGLFDHAMSTAEVLSDTLSNAEAKGLRVECLAPGFDIDTVDDLRRLRAARGDPELHCPRALAYLDRHALWPSPSGAGAGAG